MTSTEQRIVDTIAKAIEQKKMITFTYESQSGNKVSKKKVVNVEPYLIGEHKKTKNIMLSAFFLPTTEQYFAGEFEDWKLYLISNVSNITIVEIPFVEIRAKYNPNPLIMEKVLFSVSI